MGDGDGVGGAKFENSPAVNTIGVTVRLCEDLSNTSVSLTYMEKAKPVPGFRKSVGGVNTVALSNIAERDI